jgi:hypothetical protein
MAHRGYGCADGCTEDHGRRGAQLTDRPERRFADALAKTRADWAAADAAACAARAGCELMEGGVLVPLFGRRHSVSHPDGEVSGQPHAPVHVAAIILLLHYLLTADGTPPAGEWKAYRELPDGLFYHASFAGRAEAPLERAFGGTADALEDFERAARGLHGDPLPLGDAAFRFTALPRVDVAVVVWAGDDEEPGQARVLFDAHAGRYLPAEDLAGLGGQLAQRLVAAARA